MSSVASRHIDTVISVGASAAAAGGLEPLFRKSWQRCMTQHGLDPTRPTPARILPSHELREHQQRMDGFLRVARTGMEAMYQRVRDLGYMLLLTDADGITVDYIGNPASEVQLKAAGLYLGADWNEAHAGTCGVGTCLIEQTTITCHQAEHFDATHIALTCTSAPLFAPDGQLLGVLDVSALHSPEARESQHLALHLAALYAQMIEDANFLRSHARHPILRLGSAFDLVEVSGEVMFAFDDGGVIVGANTGARRRFGDFGGARSRGGALLGRTLDEVLGLDGDALRRLARGEAIAPCPGAPGRGTGPWHPVVIPARVHRLAGSSASGPTPRAAPGPRRDAGAAVGATLLDGLHGDDPAMQALVGQALRLVDRGVNLLISGETGSGKEVLARALHAASRRADQPFVAVNCASIPETLIESELFGYTPGSFTGGKSKGMKGLIAQSDGGTLFLDEIGDMPLPLQTRLLRVLSESEVLPLGADKPVALRLNVIAATHRDLRAAVAAGSFREDLYYRLCGASLVLPPLRERADRAELVDAIFRQEATRLGVSPVLGAEARRLLLAHRWPGNLRELRNALRFAVALAGDRVVAADDLPSELRASPRPASRPRPEPAAARPAAAGEEAARLLQSLRARQWNVSAAARDLKVCRATVYRRMQRHGITPPHLNP